MKSVTGKDLDPVDGQPIFGEVDGEPMSRLRWLAATAQSRKDKLVADLRAAAEQGDEEFGQAQDDADQPTG